MNFEDRLNDAFGSPINEAVDRHKVISWISHNPALRLNKVGGKYPDETYDTFSIVVSRQDLATNSLEIIGQKYDLDSDNIQRALTHFKNLGVTDDIQDVEADIDDFMNDASFYALASAKEGNIVYGIAVYSMDDPRFQNTEDEYGPDISDEELFGVSPDDINRIWNS